MLDTGYGCAVVSDHPCAFRHPRIPFPAFLKGSSLFVPAFPVLQEKHKPLSCLTVYLPAPAYPHGSSDDRNLSETQALWQTDSCLPHPIHLSKKRNTFDFRHWPTIRLVQYGRGYISGCQTQQREEPDLPQRRPRRKHPLFLPHCSCRKRTILFVFSLFFLTAFVIPPSRDTRLQTGSGFPAGAYLKRYTHVPVSYQAHRNTLLQQSR